MKALSSILLLCAIAVSGCTTCQKGGTPALNGGAVRVEARMKDVYQASSPGTRMRFFVETGKTSVPMVCIADNYHFPIIINYSARERRIEGHKGVLVDVIFQHAVSPEKNSKSVVAVNLWQPGLEKRKYKVYPTDGKTLAANP